jgi:hypothetical protein
MKYEEARDIITKDSRKSMWREEWQKDHEVFIMYWDNAEIELNSHTYRVPSCYVEFDGDIAYYCWTPSLLDTIADDWVVTEECD